MRSRYWWVFCVLAIGASCSGCSPRAFGKPDFEFTGTVYDNVTKQPIEGAYVFASYRRDVGVKTQCYKTRGMYTGKDGKYNFPIEKLDGQNPWLTSAIKPGYYFGRFDVPKPEVWKRNDASSYADRNIYLSPQDPANPSQRVGSGEEYCFGAYTREDAAAGAKFLRIELEERRKNGATTQVLEAIQGMIDSLETLPMRSEGDKVRSSTIAK